MLGTLFNTQLNAANVHCTIARHHITALTEKLANKSQNKPKKLKVLAWFVMPLELHEAFEAEDAELEANEQVELKKAAKKKANDSACALHINHEIGNRIFDCALTSYKQRDDLIALAGALLLPMKGTVAELTKVIKDHLMENLTQAIESWFSRHFGALRKCTATMASPQSVDPSIQVLPQPSTSTNSPLVLR